jgi:hypothetical protein
MACLDLVPLLILCLCCHVVRLACRQLLEGTNEQLKLRFRRSIMLLIQELFQE